MAQPDPDEDPSLDELERILEDPARARAYFERVLQPRASTPGEAFDVWWQMVRFGLKARRAIERLPRQLASHYRGELMAIARDLGRDLDLGQLDHQRMSHVVVMFLNLDDDDDDGEPVPEPLPDPGTLVPA